LLGGAALAAYAVHAAAHLLARHPEELLWGCNVALVLVGVGLVAARPVLHGVGALWLCFGTPVWLCDLAAGDAFFPTSVLPHVVGLGIALAGVRLLGMPRGAWWRALVAEMALSVLCRYATPPAANVNLAHAVWPGFDRYFHSHLAYAAAVHATIGAYLLGAEWVTRRLLAPRA
jgi:hypothetical protein